MDKIEGYNFLRVPRPVSGTTGLGPNLWAQQNPQGFSSVGPVHFHERAIISEARQAINNGLERKEAEFYVRGQLSAYIDATEESEPDGMYAISLSEWKDYLDVLFCARRELPFYLNHPSSMLCDLAITRYREFPDLCAGDKFNRFTALKG
jgi:hypothetical protein